MYVGGASATCALEEADTIDGRWASARRAMYGMASRSKYARNEGHNRARAHDHRKHRRQRERTRA